MHHRRALVLLGLLCGCAHGVATADERADAGPQSDGSLTIMQLRNPSDSAHPPLGAEVVVRDAVVTDLKTTGSSHGFFAQDPAAAAWAGVYVFVGSAAPPVVVGDVVRVSGVYSTYLGLDEIDARSGSIEKTGIHDMPDPIDVALWDIAPNGNRPLALQSMVVRVTDVVATTDTVGRDFTLGSYTSSATITVTSYMANDVGASPFPAYTGERFATIVGHAYVDGVPELAPMSAYDLVPE